MSFLSDLKSIGQHIVKGLEDAAPLLTKLGGAVPVAGPVLVEIGTVIEALDGTAVGQSLTASDVENLVTTLVQAAAIKAALPAAASATTSAATTSHTP